MKKFNQEGVTGAAGEFYFAYWVTGNFHWPCRLLDIDVGVDAQVEVFENNIATGDLFAVQVKSTVKKTPDVKIDIIDLKYWLNIETNVMLVSIVFADNYNEPKIFWKHLSHDLLRSIISAAEEKKRIPKTKLFKFSPSETLEADSKKHWLEALFTDMDRKLQDIAKSLIKGLKKPEILDFDEEVYCSKDSEKDYVVFDSEIDEINILYLDYEKLIDAISYDKRMEIRIKLVNEAIELFEQNEQAIEFMFIHAFNSISDQMVPDQILPRNLSRRVRELTDDWMTSFLTK